MGHHIRGIVFKGVLSTGVDIILVGDRVSVDLTRGTVLMGMSSLWRGLDILGFTRDTPNHAKATAGGFITFKRFVEKPSVVKVVNARTGLYT